jgi:fimbrial chaperone protein
MRRGRPWTQGRTLVSFILVVLAVSGASSAAAADFTVNPIQIFLSSQNPSAILTVQNTSTEPLRFQLNAFNWTQDAAGQMVLTPTTEVIFFPRLLSLVPGEQRIVRVGASVPQGPVERTYRIFVEELPPAFTQSAPAGQVRVLARMGIPIFIEPRTGRAELRLTPPTLQPGHVAFELRNTGTKHAIPQDIRVHGLGPAGEALWDREADAWYILAGDRRLYEVPLSREDCARTKTIAVEVKAGEQALAERLDVAAAACGP